MQFAWKAPHLLDGRKAVQQDAVAANHMNAHKLPERTHQSDQRRLEASLREAV
ncbi:hypothetical protein [Paenibacillus senegalensis]|uniref:hypothetical protein n=1 Tax=Paenibacillus senegalensis TaxID=1465766 RepID=UPI0003149F3D|nr:hypothetical protein [Paenibacillus senegalensis]